MFTDMADAASSCRWRWRATFWPCSAPFSRPGQECPLPLVAPLRGTSWRLLDLGAETVEPHQPPGRAIELQLSAQGGRVQP